jgi:membrane-associated phospholipid phosphatase
MMKDILAKITSNIFNPFVVAVILLVLLSLKAGNGVRDTITWLSITVAISVIPELIIVYILIRLKKLDSFFSNPREQRTIVYILACVLGAVDCALLWYFKGPELLAVIFTAGLIGVIVFMAINYFWKISLHTAFVAASVVALIIEYGANAAWAALVVPLVGWSRIVLKQHNILQVITGGAMAVVIIIGVFWGFGLVG